MSIIFILSQALKGLSCAPNTNMHHLFVLLLIYFTKSQNSQLSLSVTDPKVGHNFMAHAEQFCPTLLNTLEVMGVIFIFSRKTLNFIAFTASMKLKEY